MNMESENFSYQYCDANMFGYSEMNNWMQNAQTQLPPGQYYSYPYQYYATYTGETSAASPLESSASPQPRRRRNRTEYTTRQVEELNTEFKIEHYLPKLRRIELSERLNLTEKQVKIWFQNKRMKEKKEKRERESRLAYPLENSVQSSPGPLEPVQPIFIPEDYVALNQVATLFKNSPNCWNSNIC